MDQKTIITILAVIGGMVVLGLLLRVIGSVIWIAALFGAVVIVVGLIRNSAGKGS